MTSFCAILPVKVRVDSPVLSDDYVAVGLFIGRCLIGRSQTFEWLDDVGYEQRAELGWLERTKHMRRRRV